MAANSQILREYLIALGFKVDEKTHKSFERSIITAGIKLKGLALVAEAALKAAHELTVGFSREMERLYYSTRKAETAAGNLRAVEYAGQQAGLSIGGMTAAVEGFARAMRKDPGLKGMIEGMGIPVDGRDKADVLLDALEQWRRLPFYQGVQYAELFGMDSDTYLLLTESLDAMREAARLRKQMAADARLDEKAAADAGLAYAKMFREIEAKVAILKDSLALALIGPATEFARIMSGALTQLTRWISTGQTPPGIKEQIGIIKAAPGKAVSVAESYWDYTKRFWSALGEPGILSPFTGGKGVPAKVPFGSQFAGFGGAAHAASGPDTSPLKLFTEEGARLFYNDLKNGAQFSSPEVMNRVLASTSYQGDTGVSSPITLQQNNTFNIESPDPAVAGSDVAKAQSRAAQDAATTLRNTLTKVK